MKNKKIVIAGGTGFIGQGLLKYFGKDNDIVILTRKVSDHESNFYGKKYLSSSDGYRVRYREWDATNAIGEWVKDIDGADMVINLTGKSVNCRYHKKQKQAIINSRVNATKAIGVAIDKANSPPSLWINAASSTIYRHTLIGPNDEYTGIISDLKKDNMPFNIVDHLRYLKNKTITRLVNGKDSPGYRDLEKDFSVQVCKIWEKTFFDQTTNSTRKITLRTAIVLGEDGVLVPYFNLCKFGLGGAHGSGRQMFSWVHIEDVARMMEWLFEKSDAEGIYNCVAPGAITNRELLKTLREATGHRFGLPSPALLLELGAFLIRTETELMLKSRWVYPARAIKEGFIFRFPKLKAALNNIVEKIPRKQYHLF